MSAKISAARPPLLLSAILVAAIAGLLIYAVEDVVWSQNSPSTNHARNQITVQERQTELWQQGLAAGERYIQSGGAVLARAEIDRKADELHPRDFTASVLWAAGFETGQIQAKSRR